MSCGLTAITINSADVIARSSAIATLSDFVAALTLVSSLSETEICNWASADLAAAISAVPIAPTPITTTFRICAPFNSVNQYGEARFPLAAPMG
ncbi:unannotated protein [freshwater metagenome]|uniref:Unannotated protein n=1 Tax=freshwater metagenome TaxID=449393 RepID=A0A6J6E6P4_9ZZZZ